MYLCGKNNIGIMSQFMPLYAPDFSESEVL